MDEQAGRGAPAGGATGACGPQTAAPPGEGHRRRAAEAARSGVGWWRRAAGGRAAVEAAALLWLVALAGAFLMPALRYGTALGPFDLGNSLSGLGHGLYPGVHNGWLGDEIEELLPWNTFDWRQIHHLRFPLWNPESLLGLPQFFNFQSAVLSLPDLVGYAVPLRLSFLAAAATKLALAGTGAYVLGRVSGWGRAGAVFAATAFELSGPFASEIGWPLADVFAWLGWIFAFTWLICRDGAGRPEGAPGARADRGERGRERLGAAAVRLGGGASRDGMEPGGRTARTSGQAPEGGEVPRSGPAGRRGTAPRGATARRHIALLAVCVAFAVYGGFPEADVLLAAAWGVFATTLLLAPPHTGRGLAAARLAAGWAAGLALSAPLWLPGTQLLVHSARFAVRQYPSVPLGTLPALLLQGYDGYPTSSSVWFGPLTYYETVSYVGVAVAVLAAVGAWGGCRRRSRQHPGGGGRQPAADKGGAAAPPAGKGGGEGRPPAGEGGAAATPVGGSEGRPAASEGGAAAPPVAATPGDGAGRPAGALSAAALSATALAMAAVTYGPDPFALLGSVLPGAAAVVPGRARIPLAFALCCLAGLGLRDLRDACTGHATEARESAASARGMAVGPGAVRTGGADARDPGGRGAAGADARDPGGRGTAGAEARDRGGRGTAGAEARDPGSRRTAGAGAHHPGRPRGAGADARDPRGRGTAGADARDPGSRGVAAAMRPGTGGGGATALAQGAQGAPAQGALAQGALAIGPPAALRAFVAAAAAVAAVLAGLLVWTLVQPGSLTPAEVAIRLRSFVWGAATLGAVGAAAWLLGAERGRRVGGRLGRRGTVAAGLLLSVETAFLLTSGVALNTYSHRFFAETQAERALEHLVAPVAAVPADAGHTGGADANARGGLPPARNGGPVGFAAEPRASTGHGGRDGPRGGGGAGGAGWSAYRGLGLIPEMNLAYGIPEMAAYDPMVPAGYADAWSAETGAPPEPGGWFVPTFGSAAEARTWGVPYVLGPRGAPAPPGMVRVASLGTEDLYRVPGAHRFTLAGSGAPATGGSAPGSGQRSGHGAGQGAGQGSRHASARAFARVSAGGPVGHLLRIRQQGDAAWLLRVATVRPARLVVRLTAVPGWHATVDGRLVPLRPWHQVMQQLELPPGVHVVRLWYWPRLFTLGLALCAAAAAALAAACLWPTRERSS